MFHAIKCSFAALVFGSALAVAAQAKQLAITSAEPVAIVTIPDAWSGTKIARGLEIKTPDDEVYLWFELIAPADMPAVQKEHDGYFEKQGVTITGASETTKVEVKGRPWSFTELKATSGDGPSIIRYIAINPGVQSGKIILATYWASPGGEKIHDAAMQALFEGMDFR